MAKMKQKRMLAKFLGFLALLIIAAGVYHGYHIYRFMADIRQADPQEFEEEQVEPKETPAYHRTNILLLGIDARTPNERSRTDTIMLLSLDEATRDVSLLSIPRDSRVNIPGRGLDKINHAHAFGGVALTVETVEAFLGVPVHYYARINFEGFAEIIDILGGVTIEVENIVAANTPELKAGKQRLNGEQALAYVRNRSDSDIGRAKRQQKLIKTVAKESYQLSTILKVPQLLENLGNNLRTNMPLTDMVKVANLFISVDIDAIAQGVIPLACAKGTVNEYFQIGICIFNCLF
ncbi:MAG TPA: LCP family protein [Firmicutes bacterium]|nr:LCP family protein [Bacillota bacterium]